MTAYHQETDYIGAPNFASIPGLHKKTEDQLKTVNLEGPEQEDRNSNQLIYSSQEKLIRKKDDAKLETNQVQIQENGKVGQIDQLGNSDSKNQELVFGRKSDITSSSALNQEEEIVFVDQVKLAQMRGKFNAQLERNQIRLGHEEIKHHYPQSNKNLNDPQNNQWQKDFYHFRDQLEVNNNSMDEQGSSARFEDIIQPQQDYLNARNNIKNKDEGFKFQESGSSGNEDRKTLQNSNQASIRTDSGYYQEKDNSSSQYDSPIPTNFQGFHQMQEMKSILTLNQINCELKSHLRRFDEIITQNQESIQKHLSLQQPQTQYSMTSNDVMQRMGSKQDLNQTPKFISQTQVLRMPSQQERKSSSYYSISQHSSFQKVNIVSPSKGASSKFVSDFHIRKSTEQRMDEMLLQHRSSSGLQTNQQHRFNKQFFEDLKKQQIGFATILQERKPFETGQSKEDIQFQGLGTQTNQNAKLLLDSQKWATGQHNIFGDEWNVKKKNSKFLENLHTKIEQNNQLKQSVERAIILFNEKPKKGIDFLVKQKFIDYDAQIIAEFLLTTPGLSKYAIGQYIGLNDPFSKEVLKEFSNKLDFRELEVDEALRFFLQQFRLPGESQQIDRIIEQFSNTYYLDNAYSFRNVDGVYVMAYSLIFLNTLNHNQNVAASRKLTKQMFIQQNKIENPNFPDSKLEEMFDRIMQNQFKTDTLFVEKIYERIRAFNHEETTKETIKLSTNVLQQGEQFLKFGRMGKPHLRFVYVSDDEQNLFWCIQRQGNRKSRIKCIRCDDIVDIRVGYNSSKILVKHQIPIEFDDLIFSIVTNKRTLDLQAKDSEIRNRWVKFLKIILNENLSKLKVKDVSQNIEAYERRQRIQHDLEEIWENDIMTNFAEHWDYQNHCPKKQSKQGKIQSQAKQSGSKKKRSWICKINPKNCWNEHNRRILKNEKKGNHQGHLSNRTSDYSPERDFDFDSQSQGFFLESLWRRGIPPKFRKKIWPFAIQNKLEISKQLYRMNLKEGLSIVNSIQKSLRTQKKGLQKQIIEKIDQDIKNTLQTFKIYFMRESNLSNKCTIKHKEYGQEEFKEIFEIANSIDRSKLHQDDHFQFSDRSNTPQDHLKIDDLEIKRQIEIITPGTASRDPCMNQSLNEAPPRIPLTSNNNTFLQNQSNGTVSGAQYNLRYESLFNNIIAFIMQRPDIGYLPNVSYLAGMFLIYCNEYDSYAAFTNFIHSHYFLDLFKGQLSDIKLRINQFNKHFQKLMPDLFRHFETLDITTDLFLIDWMLTLYSKNMDLDIASRIWDNFMLDGEIFAIKTGLAILQYLENQLLKQSYFQIVKQLKNLQGNIIEEDKFFSLIELIKIDELNYYADIKMQKWSYQKSKVLGSVFM